jgi:hypothetical protein
MIKRINLWPARVIFACLASSAALGPQLVLAQGTPADQYKQMGGIAAVAEACYGSKAIPQKLNQSIKGAVTANPQIEGVMKTLLADYNAAYYKSITDHKIWSGSKGDYGDKAFSCANAADVELIKKFESSILASLK